jgi:hypothetical protein
LLLLLLLLGWLWRWEKLVTTHLGLAQSGSKCCVLNAELIHEGAAFLPPSICFIGRCQCGIKKL